jgi:SpoVK/Ycf46/Vps4 family AAA+-type ATPase
MCNLLGIIYKYKEKSVTVIKHNIETTYKFYTLFFDNIHENLPSLVYDSKFDITKNNKIINLHTIKITQDEFQEYYGFEISNNGRFLLSDCTVTHNTTIAQIIGEMYKNMGILSINGKFTVAKREDFIAEYLGQTAIKTKKLLTDCIGGVLFIDEVYALGPTKGDKDSFSKEAIDTLNVFLSEHSDEFCCIIAGYEEEIKQCFFNVNQGLQRRFQWIHRIDTYTINDLCEMFFKEIYEIRWKTDLDKKTTIEILNQNKKLFKFAGGDIQNLITKCKIAHATRLLNTKNAIKYLITKEDLLKGLELMLANKLITQEDDVNFNMYI